MHTKGVAIILTVEDNLGCKVSRTASVKLSQPLAEVQHSSKLLCSSTQLNFGHYAGNSQHIGALSYNWVLNSNQTFNQQANSFSFNTEGTQTLKLVVRETALGCVDSRVLIILPLLAPHWYLLLLINQQCKTPAFNR